MLIFVVGLYKRLGDVFRGTRKIWCQI